MPDQVLSIDANDLQHFFLRVDGDTLTIGRDPAAGDGMLRHLHIKGIRCELQVSDDSLAVTSADLNGHASDQVLIANQERRLDSARLRVAPAPAGQSAEAPKAKPDFRLVALNGPDFGRVFHLTETGSTRIGTDPRAANLVLRDIYAAQVQCKLEIAGEEVFVTHLDGSGGTFINRNRILGRTALRTGDVLRVGNTQLRFDIGKANGVGHAEAAPPRDFRPQASLPPLAVSPPTPLLATPPPPAPTPPPTPAPREVSPLERLLHLENQQFGHFQIEHALGKGQAGVVFRARDVKTGHTVALKVLSPEFPKSEAEIQHLSRVFKPLAALRDSHLVALKCLGRTDNYTWIAREYVDGESLCPMLANTAVDSRTRWRRACRVAAQIGAALDVLHQHKIAHINLTPRNILIRREDNVAKLADVLLAQALQGSHLEQEIRGKKRVSEAVYLAPEQLGNSSEPDAKSDLYALGVMCYQLATGRLPYPGPSIEEVQTQMSWGAVSKPSRHNAEIPPPFEAAILKLLSRNPASRFADIGEFLDIVEPILMMHDIK
jgi:pSer/pThr/pTyr-binding forkhead associated (FHA) protein